MIALQKYHTTLRGREPFRCDAEIRSADHTYHSLW
jgi:hypothetical protein